MTILDTACALAAAGLPVLPLYAWDEGLENQRGKHPRQTKWPTRSNSPEVLRILWARHPESNVGLVTGARSGLICVDLDPRNGADVWRQQHRDAVKASGAGIERTGSGGWHLWYRHPGGIVRSRRGKDGIAPGVELLADGGHQAVIAPSKHKSEVLYEWKSSMSLIDIRDFGAALPGWIALPESTTPAMLPAPTRAGNSESYADREADIQTVRRKLQSVPVAVEGDGGDHTTFAACCLGRDHDLSPAAFLPLLHAWNERCQPPWPHDQLEIKLRNAYAYAKAAKPGEASASAVFEAAPLPPEEPVVVTPAVLPPAEQAAIVAGLVEWTDDILKAKDGSWRSHVRNVDLALTYDPRLQQTVRFNEFTNAVEVQTDPQPPWREWVGVPEWGDDDAVALATWMAQTHGAAIDPGTIHAAVRPYARTRAYHPVREYLRSLRWDGVSRTSTWLATFAGAIDSPYLQAVSRRFLIGAVARVMRPGCKLDTMLVLEGPQGIGKSRLVRLLFNGWYTDAELDTANKDVSAIIRGHWGVEFGEMHAASRAEVSQLKAFLSRCEDRQRDAYARTPETVARQSVFVGTTNRDVYLPDSTGGRRFWPVELCLAGSIDLEALAAVRDQLWAEAWVAYEAGEPWWLSREEEGPARLEQAARRVGDEAEDQITQWVAHGGDFGVSQSIMEAGVTGLEVWQGALGGSPVTFRRVEQMRVSECMRALGWKRTTFRRGDKVSRGYVKG